MNGPENICRTCLARGTGGEKMWPVNHELQVAGSVVRFSDILETFYHYKTDTNDEYSQQICLACTHQLIATHNFHILIKNSFMKLTQTVMGKFQTEHDRSTTESLTDLDNSQNHSDWNECKLNASVTSELSKKCKILYCIECEEKFSSASSLRSHYIKNHKPKQLIGHPCKYCNEKLKNFRSLMIHHRHHLYQHICYVCWSGFDNEDDLNTHFCKKTGHKSDKKMSQCDQCGKSYPIGYIKLHMRIHGTETFYTCKYCPKKFKVRCSLNSHTLWAHTKSRNHKCDVCGATFVTASAKSAHKRKYHLLEKKHMCETCGKKFFSKSEMQRHMLTHTGEKHFHCHLCEKSYQTRYGLNVHLKSHSALT